MLLVLPFSLLLKSKHPLMTSRGATQIFSMPWTASRQHLRSLKMLRILGDKQRKRRDGSGAQTGTTAHLRAVLIRLAPMGVRSGCSASADARALRRRSGRGPGALASAFAVYTAIATTVSSSLMSFLEPCPLGAIAQTCCRTLACRSVTSMSRKDRSEKSCVPSLLWVQVFNPWVQVFNLHMPSTRWNLVATRKSGEGEFELWQQVFNLLIRQETR